SVLNKDCRVLIPVDDIDLLAPELGYNGVYSRAVHSHAGSYRIHVRIIAPYGDLRSGPGFSCNTSDLHCSVSYFSHLGFKKSFHKSGMCSGKEDTGTFGRILHFKDINLDPLGRLEFLALHLLVLTEDTVGSSQVDADIPSHHPLYDTGDNLFLLTVILIVENLALLLADLLQDHIFGVLRGDSSVLLRLALRSHDLAVFRVGIEL